MTDSQLERFTKIDLIRMLKSAVQDQSGDDVDAQSIRDLFKQLSANFQKEVAETLAPIKAELIAVKNDNASLRNEVSELKKAISAQQRFIHFAEKEKRAGNVVIRGVTENEAVDNTITDHEKVLAVLKKANPGLEDNSVRDCRRLGKNPGKRPILVQLGSVRCARACLAGGKNLKGYPDMSTVYINRDLTPAEHKAEVKLRRLYRELKTDPNNAGKTVLFTKGKLTVDGVTVDSVDNNLPFLE